MESFVEGDVVTDGSRTGQVVSSFYWKDSDDGTMNEPKGGNLPIMWEDGTQGYRPPTELRYA